MKDFHYYTGADIKKPNRNDFTMFYVYSAGVCLWSGPINEWQTVRKSLELPKGHITQTIVNEDAFQTARFDTNERIANRRNEFDDDLMRELGLTVTAYERLSKVVATIINDHTNYDGTDRLEAFADVATTIYNYAAES